MKSRFVTIDPGLKHLGWAVFESNKEKPIASGTLSPPRKVDWLHRLEWLVEKLSELIKEHDPSLIIIEEPQLFMSSAKGSSASASGSVLKLTALVHSLKVLGEWVYACEVKLIKVSRWKGQVPKHIMHKRLGLTEVSEISLDEADAIALGLWYMRKCL